MHFRKVVTLSLLFLLSCLTLSGVLGKASLPSQDLKLEWWSLEFPHFEGDPRYIVHLGAFRFDPKLDAEAIWNLPGRTSGGPLLVQAIVPSSMVEIMGRNGDTFDLIDIVSSSSIVVQPQIDLGHFLLSIGPYARAVVPYHPLFKVEGGLFHRVSAMDGEGTSPLILGLYTPPDEDLLRTLDDLCIGGSTYQPMDGTVSGTFRLGDVMDLSRIEGVSHVSLGWEEGPDNDVSADIIDVMEVQNTLSLDGTGLIISVVDTGLDTGQNSTLHGDFQGRIERVYTYGRPGNWSDADIHVWNPSTSSWD
ncbi:MAG: hypothetical protein JXA22_08295 [Candidatus Thermoplasmatota archaeon]|nr:hypothetical protein [Candidatus Thermoplasmatota archaeon]